MNIEPGLSVLSRCGRYIANVHNVRDGEVYYALYSQEYEVLASCRQSVESFEAAVNKAAEDGHRPFTMLIGFDARGGKMKERPNNPRSELEQKYREWLRSDEGQDAILDCLAGFEEEEDALRAAFYAGVKCARGDCEET